MVVYRLALVVMFFVIGSVRMVCAQPAATPPATAMPATKPIVVPGAVKSEASPGPLLSASPTAIPSPLLSPIVLPLTESELRVPEAALAASRKTIGGSAWTNFGAVFVSGIAQVQNQSLPFTYSANLKTGYNRMIVLLPRNGGTYEYGVDKACGWSASGGVVHPLASTIQNLKTALYVNRMGFLNFPADAASLEEKGVDANLGDRIKITPAGGTAMLALIKPSTSLVSAIQFANGQVNVFADYRPISGVLFPFRTMQGSSANALSVFQATTVELLAKEPDPAPISRPRLPTVSVSPGPRATSKPAVHEPKTH